MQFRKTFFFHSGSSIGAKGSSVDKTLQHIESLSNPNVYVDMSQSEQLKKDTHDILCMESSDQTKIGYVKVYVNTGSHISFTNRSDIHFMTANQEVLEKLNDYYRNTRTYVFDHGDMLQVPVEGHHTGESGETRLNADEELDLFDSSLDGLESKILAASGGTHDDPEFASRIKDSYVRILKKVYEKHGISYFPNGMVVEFVCPVIKNGRVVDYTSLWAAILHCYGKPASKKLGSAQKTFDQGMALVRRFNEAAYGKDQTKYICPDFILGGHFHANADLDQVVKQYVYDKSGQPTGVYMKTVRVRSASTLQKNNSNSYNRTFTDYVIPNFTQYDVHFEINKKFDPSKTTLQYPKYIPIVTEFELLTSNGKLSTFAKEYQQARPDYDFTDELRKEKLREPIVDSFNDFIENANYVEKELGL